MAIGRPISLTGNIASKTIRVIATEDQTAFTVDGGYNINQISVFRNGVRLSNNTDFTALDGTTVTLTTGANLNDEVLFQIQEDFRVADAIVSAASSQTINGNLAITGELFYQGSGTGILTTGGDGSNLSGIVTSITAGDNISVSGSTGNVTITGIANTANIVADTLIVSGVTTSTGGFVGDVTGNADTATYATTAGVSTNAQGLTGTPNITVGSVQGTTGTFSGSVSIGGTLTYEDVTNVDSVGIVTAQSGISVTGGRYTNQTNAVAALDVDMSQGNYFTKTITTGINTFTFSNPPSSGTVGSFTLELTHTGGTADWPTTVKWPEDTAPSLSTSRTHLFMFVTDDGGSRYRGAALANYVN